MDIRKIKGELSWAPRMTFPLGIEETVNWYRENASWTANVMSGDYREYYQRMYGGLLGEGA
jgi:dTDP-glucose 4,6-dehydratase